MIICFLFSHKIHSLLLKIGKIKTPRWQDTCILFIIIWQSWFYYKPCWAAQIHDNLSPSFLLPLGWDKKFGPLNFWKCRLFLINHTGCSCKIMQSLYRLSSFQKSLCSFDLSTPTGCESVGNTAAVMLNMKSWRIFLCGLWTGGTAAAGTAVAASLVLSKARAGCWGGVLWIYLCVSWDELWILCYGYVFDGSIPLLKVTFVQYCILQPKLRLFH